MRSCPYCAERIPGTANYCPYCTRKLRLSPAPWLFREKAGIAFGVAAALWLLFVRFNLYNPKVTYIRDEIPVTRLVEVTRPVTATPPLPLGENAGVSRVSPIDGMTQLYVPAGNFLVGTNATE